MIAQHPRGLAREGPPAQAPAVDLDVVPERDPHADGGALAAASIDGSSVDRLWVGVRGGRKIVGYPPDLPDWANEGLALLAIAALLAILAAVARRRTAGA